MPSNWYLVFRWLCNNQTNVSCSKLVPNPSILLRRLDPQQLQRSGRLCPCSGSTMNGHGRIRFMKDRPADAWGGARRRLFSSGIVPCSSRQHHQEAAATLGWRPVQRRKNSIKDVIVGAEPCSSGEVLRILKELSNHTRYWVPTYKCCCVWLVSH